MGPLRVEMNPIRLRAQPGMEVFAFIGVAHAEGLLGDDHDGDSVACARGVTELCLGV